jgi:hypothetical protein
MRTTKSSAFLKGGLGCLGLFLVVGLIFLIAGGHVYIDLGGAICLFVVGGVLGLLIFAIWRRGYLAGRRETEGGNGIDSEDQIGS